MIGAVGAPRMILRFVGLSRPRRLPDDLDKSIIGDIPVAGCGPGTPQDGGDMAVTTLAKGSRITGAQRDSLASTYAKRYAAGESIRKIAEDSGRSYGFVHGVLKESGAALRGRGGATRGPARKAAKSAPAKSAGLPGEGCTGEGCGDQEPGQGEQGCAGEEHRQGQHREGQQGRPREGEQDHPREGEQGRRGEEHGEGDQDRPGEEGDQGRRQGTGEEGPNHRRRHPPRRRPPRRHRPRRPQPRSNPPEPSPGRPLRPGPVGTSAYGRYGAAESSAAGGEVDRCRWPVACGAAVAPR